MNLNINDEVMFYQCDKLYKGCIKSIQDGKIEIDDDTVEMMVMAISKGTIAETLLSRRDKPKRKWHYSQRPRNRICGAWVNISSGDP